VDNTAVSWKRVLYQTLCSFFWPAPVMGRPIRIVST